MSLVYQKSVNFLDQICNDDCSKARGQLVPLTCALFIQQFSLEIFASLNSPKVFSATTNGILKQIIHAQQVKHCCCDFLFLLLSHYTGFKTRVADIPYMIFVWQTVQLIPVPQLSVFQSVVKTFCRRR